MEINIVADVPSKSKQLHTTKRPCKGVERSEISQQLLNDLASNW